ncbi:MAG: hypothetical protein ABI091_13760 [Ferruginibacter sp.]
MKTASKIILPLSLALIIFGYWGAFTNQGNKVYDEMDAYYPFFMLLMGIFLLIVFFILLMIIKRKKNLARKGSMHSYDDAKKMHLNK